MHIPSYRNSQEMLASPGLVRFVLADGRDGKEATLLIKAPSLALKYLLRLRKLRLSLFRAAGSRVGYGVQLDDDPDHTGTGWSIFEFPDELAGAEALTSMSKCVVFLFNELAVNVAWGEVQFDLSSDIATRLLSSARLDPIPDYSEFADAIHHTLTALREGTLPPENGIQLDWSEVPEWHPITSHYITAQADRSLLSIFETNEGKQQEEIAHWLVDNLQPTGAHRSPQVHEEGGVRELSDLLLSHQYGAFLIESKTLAILARPEIPRRNKLAAQIRKHHLPEAIRQLTGGLKNLRRGLRITDMKGKDIEVERKALPHIIVLVPDLTLLHDADEFGAEFFKAKCVECEAFFHILDPAQLLRLAQAATKLAQLGKTTTKLMAFDHLLMGRAKRSWAAETPDFDVIHKFVERPDPNAAGSVEANA